MNGEILSNELSHLPYVDQYCGVWAMLEERFNALRVHAQQLNVQLHLEKMAEPMARAEIAARGSTDVHVTQDRIAIVEIRGTMMKQTSSFSAGASTIAVRKQIRSAAADEEVAGILLVVDSPGGTLSGTHDLGADVAAAARRKPVFGFAEDLAASGGYWVLSQASKVFANKTAFTGAIGVFAVVYDLSVMAEKEGIQTHVIKFGEFKGRGIAGTEVTGKQLADFQRQVDAAGGHFVEAVRVGRGVSREAAEQLADGRLHMGQAAVDLKLIDGIQSLDDTLAELVAETQQPRNRRTRAMSQDKPKVTDEQKILSATAEPIQPTAATIDQLEAALPGASSDFLVAQMKKGATKPQAVEAHAAELAKENAALKEKAAALEQEKAEAAAAFGKNKGVVPLTDAESQEDLGGLSAAEAFNEKVDALIDKGKSRFEAVRLVAAKHPDLRENMVDAANAQRLSTRR